MRLVRFSNTVTVINLATNEVRKEPMVLRNADVPVNRNVIEFKSPHHFIEYCRMKLERKTEETDKDKEAGKDKETGKEKKTRRAPSKKITAPIIHFPVSNPVQLFMALVKRMAKNEETLHRHNGPINYHWKLLDKNIRQSLAHASREMVIFTGEITTFAGVLKEAEQRCFRNYSMRKYLSKVQREYFADCFFDLFHAVIDRCSELDKVITRFRQFMTCGIKLAELTMAIAARRITDDILNEAIYMQFVIEFFFGEFDDEDANQFECAKAVQKRLTFTEQDCAAGFYLSELCDGEYSSHSKAMVLGIFGEIAYDCR